MPSRALYVYRLEHEQLCPALQRDDIIGKLCLFTYLLIYCLLYWMQRAL